MHKMVKILSSDTLKLLKIVWIMLVPLDPLKLLELNAKQLANQPAHLPRVQTPVHIIHMEKEFLEYTIQGDPRT